MAKEDQDVLKMVELKVSVNCCEGCKRKVLKALSMKGVLKVEIHPSLPRVRVISNVDVPVLIKKLARIRKTAELWPAETPEQTQINRQTAGTIHATAADDESISGHDKASSISTPQVVVAKMAYPSTVAYLPPMNYSLVKAGMDDQLLFCCCSTTPIMPTGHSARPPPCCNRECYNNEPAPVYLPPPTLPQPTGFEDFFNDDYTSVCRVM